MILFSGRKQQTNSQILASTRFHPTLSSRWFCALERPGRLRPSQKVTSGRVGLNIAWSVPKSLRQSPRGNSVSYFSGNSLRLIYCFRKSKTDGWVEAHKGAGAGQKFIRGGCGYVKRGPVYLLRPALHFLSCDCGHGLTSRAQEEDGLLMPAQ